MSRWHLPIAGALACALVSPSLAAPVRGFPIAQGPRPGAPSSPPREARPPVPPGVPTSPDNVHLPTEGEVKLGREGSAEVEKYYKIVSSGPEYERLQRVAREVVRAFEREDIIAEYRRKYGLPRKGDRSRRVPFEYSFKLLDTEKEINAFSLAGGPIYVTRGLLGYATSDHELAAVLAHECAHVAFHHVEQLVKKQKRESKKQLWGLLATILAGAAGGGNAAAAASNVALGSQLISIATLTGYGQDLEREADRMGVRALTSTPYSPVGMMTFMQKLARDDYRRGNPDFGIFQSHPYSSERVAAIAKELQALGFRVDEGALRQVSGRFRLTTVPIRVNGMEAAEIRLNGHLVFTAVGRDGGAGPVERAEAVARRLELLFSDNLSVHEVKLAPDRSAVLIRGAPMFRPTPEEAAFAGGPTAAQEKAYREISRALLQEQIDKPF